MTKRIIILTIIIFLIIIGLGPITIMFLKSATINGHLNLTFYKTLLNTPHQWHLLYNSLSLSFTTALLTTLIGLPLGILIGKTDLPAKNTLLTLFTIPLIIPPYITALSWFAILGRDGLLSQIFGQSIGYATSSWLFGFHGCVLVLFTTYLPVVILLTITYIKTINPELEQIALLSASPFYVLKKITIPLIIPGTLLASLLVFLLTLGEFGVPTFLRYDVFPVESFIRFSAFYDFGSATAAAIPLILIAAILLLVERIFLRNKTFRFTPYTNNKNIKINLGKYKKIVIVITWFLAIIIVILPLMVLFTNSLSIKAYRQALSQGWMPLARSLWYAIIGATVISITGFFLGYIIYNKEIKLWRAVDSLTIFLFALPGTVIGIGMISMWNNPLTNFIYSTPIIIILGYIARYSALTSRITVSTLARIPASMEEAAMSSGAPWLYRIFHITIPLSRDGLITAWLVAYIFSMRDIGITMLVYPPGHDTLPVRIFTLMANGKPDLIAALSVIMIIAAIIPLAIGKLLIKSKKHEYSGIKKYH